MRFAVATVVFLLFGAALPVGADVGTGDVDALLARVRAAGGAPYANHIVSRYRVEADARTFDMTAESEGYRSLVRRCRDVVCAGTYFDGERVYDVNINDTALPRTLHDDNDARTLRAVETGAFASPEFRATGGTIVALADAHHGGATLHRLAISVGEGDPIEVLIDAGSALVVATADADGDVVEEFRDFRKVGGVTLPFEVWHDGVRERQYSSRVIVSDSLRLPAGITPSFSGPPAALAMHAPPGARDANVTTPVVPCAIGEIHTSCLIDSGNSSLGISLELAERLNVEPAGEFEVAGLGHYATGLVSAGPIHVGNATYPVAKFVVLHDLHDYGYDVVLGADAFAHATISIDYAANSVRFAPAGGSIGATAMPLAFLEFVPYVTAQLGAFDALLAIDTGDEAAINVSNSYFAAHPALFAPRGTQTVSGIGGEGEQVIGELPSVRIATFEVLHQQIAATASSIATASGHLGGAFLANFDVVFDYAEGRLGLTPRAGDKSVRQIQ